MPTKSAQLICISQQAAMMGGFAMLLAELRFEHRGVIVGDFRPWIPLGYCACMLILIPACTFLWKRGGSRLLRLAYILSMAVGLAGLIFHSDGHLLARLADLLKVWTSDLNQSASFKAHYPPPLAPSAFIGLGLLGLLQCLSQTVQLPKDPTRPAQEGILIATQSLAPQQPEACYTPEGDGP